MTRVAAPVSLTIERSGMVLIVVLVALGWKDLGLARGIAGGLLVVASLLVHELAHTFAARYFGVAVHGIGIQFTGAYTRRKYASRPQQDAMIAAAGPVASVVVVFAAAAIPKVGLWVAAWNICIVALNLLPIAGTDGHRILRSLFWPDAEIYKARPVYAEVVEVLRDAA